MRTHLGAATIALCALLVASHPASAGSPGAPVPETLLPSDGRAVVEQAVAVDPRDPRRIAVSGVRLEAHRYADAVQEGYQPENHIWLSSDGGRTFAAAGRLPYPLPDAETASLDATLAWLPSGVLVATYLGADLAGPHPDRNGLWFARSTDGGRSWSGKRVVANTYAGESCAGADFPQVTVDPARRTLWIVYQHIVAEQCLLGGPFDVRVLRSDDGGRTWSPPRPLGPDVSYTPRATVLGDGTLAVAHLEASPARGPVDGLACGKVYQALVLSTVSRRGTVTKQVLEPELCSAETGTDLLGKVHRTTNVPTIAYDRSSNRLVVVATDVRPGGAGSALLGYVTSDSGRTVREVALSSRSPAGAPFMPQASAGEGFLAVAYLQGTPGGLYVPSLVSSSDGGLSWSGAVPLATEPSVANTRPDMVLDPYGIGHYLGIAIGSDAVARVAWPDLRASTDPEMVRTYVGGVSLKG